MDWDEGAITRWLEPLIQREDEFADVFAERLRETRLDWSDGEVREVRVLREQGTSARWRRGGQELLVHEPGTGEAAVREAVRGLRAAAGRPALPIRAARSEPETDSDLGAERWTRKLIGIFSRHAPRHRFRFRLRSTERRILTPGGPARTASRRLISLEGRFTAASRPGDEERDFAFHAPDSDGAADELKRRLAAAAAPRDRAGAVPASETDVVLGAGCAAVLFHEILGHPLEADADSTPLSGLPAARLAAAELDVEDDPRRLDLFGGYECDDEGTLPQPVRLLRGGALGGRLTDRAHAGRAAASSGHGRRAGPGDPPLPRGSNVVVGPGAATPDEMARRLQNGIWIEEFGGGSVELSSGAFRLAFPRARRVRRGRMADELGPGILSGDILTALHNLEPVLGREVHVCRSLGWCSRGGQVLPVQGAAPDVLVRRMAARAAL